MGHFSSSTLQSGATVGRKKGKFGGCLLAILPVFVFSAAWA